MRSAVRRSTARRIVPGSPAWKPQARFALVTTEKSASSSPTFVSRWSSNVDPVNLLFLASASLIAPSGENDGLVRVEDAKWGTFLGCLPADHVDEIGQIFGQSPGLGNSFDHLTFYADVVAWLRAQGY
mgnify:CR=1 FL=1